MDKILQSNVDELNSLLIKEYNQAIKVVYDWLIDTYEDICVNDEPLMSKLYSYNRYYTLINKINKRLTALGSKEVDLFTERLTKMYEDTAKQIGTQLSVSTDIDEEKIKEVLKTPWVGEDNYSDRIWKNKGLLVKKIKDDLIQSIITGKSPETFSVNLRDNLLVDGYYPIRRLINTEMSRMHLQATVDKYKEVGITKVKILEAMDDRTCEACAARNGQVISISSIRNGGEILNHPNCRVSITATF